MKYTPVAAIQKTPVAIAALLAFLFFGLIHPEPMYSQKYYTAEKSFGVKLGVTKPLYFSAFVSSSDSAKIKELKKNKPQTIPNFYSSRHIEHPNPNALPQGPDPVWMNMDDSRMQHEILPIINIEGINSTQSPANPPDPNGDISKDHFVEIVNSTNFKVFNKLGNSVSNLISTNTIWSQIGQSNFSDPVLLYDQAVERWFLAEIAPTNTRRVLVAISETSDPLGSWAAYMFQAPQLPDFPKFAIWPDAYYMTTNESGFNFPVYAFNRADLLAGADTIRMQRLTIPKIGGVFFEVGQPVDWDGLPAPPTGSPGLFVKMNDDGWGTTIQDKILLNKVTIDWDNQQNSHIEVIPFTSAPFDTDGCQLEGTGQFSCIPQPNNQGIDGAEWIITNKSQYRNLGGYESFVLSFMVDVTGDDVAGVRWMEFRKTSTEDWHIHQEGTIGSDDGIHRFMPSIGINGHGDIGIGYAVSGYDKHPSLRFSGRYATDPPGTMTFNEYEFATGTGSQGQSRFGDYASMSVDPSDDATFWFAGEYSKVNGSWGTKIVSFNPSRDTFDVLPAQADAPQSSADLGLNEPVQITVVNRGRNTVPLFNVSYQFDGGGWVSEPAGIDSLQVNQAYQHTFGSTIAFPNLGAYSLQVATGLDIDDNKRNDTLSLSIVKYGKLDAALEYIVPVPQNVICGGESHTEVYIRNMGGDTIHNLLMELVVGNHFPVPIPWSGSLAFGEETIISFDATGLEPGNNTLQLNAIEVNGLSDDIPVNNLITWNIEARPDGQIFTLHFRTDNFPGESTWKLFDDGGNIIASDGPFADVQHSYTTSLCLDPEACYTFTVYDAFGDGLNQGIPKGDFEIVNGDGELVVKMARPNFGSEVSNEFCVTGECMFTLQAGVIHESAVGLGDGMVIAETANSLGTIMYSLDGGQTFQSGNIFSGLVPGHYTMLAHDGAGCVDSIAFDIVTCNLQALITTLPAIGGDVGEIHIAVIGGIGAITYSLNGGGFVQDSFFRMLEPGDYIVTIQDSLGCTIQDTVTVSTQVGTSQPTGSYFLRISPNPGNGVFYLEAMFQTEQIFVPYIIFDAQGEPVYYGSVVRYNDVYKDELVLRNVPEGLYYIVFQFGHERVASRIINLKP